MAYKPTDISVLAYANNFTMWHYTTTDTSITTTGYFNIAADMLRVNDLIIANFNTGTTPTTKFYIVTGNTGSVVIITLYT